ncbi:MAG TPA: EAL domain-containing protein [Gammaproteobacteria bacterium]|nr:EAL domain-containing protein [Gammaproteobacteria bacterium]
MTRFGFKRRVLLLAVALVVATQLVTLFPVLDLIKRDAEDQAVRTVGLAGQLLDEYRRNRAEQLLTNVNLLVSDYGFKQAVTTDNDDATMRSVLRNAASRVGAPVAALLHLDGHVLVSTSADDRPVVFPSIPVDELEQDARDRVVSIGGVPYQTVTVPLRAPATVAWVTLGFPIDSGLAAQLASLTGLEVSFVAVQGIAPRVLISTLPEGLRAGAIDGLDAHSTQPQRTGAGESAHLSLIRTFAADSDELYVVMQLAETKAMASFRRVRNFLYAMTGLSLLLAISGSFWLAKTVTRPVQNLADAARRMREGVYTEPINIPTGDEFGELAGSFNAMQQAIADRERRIFHQAHHDTLSGLPNRELAVSLLGETLERNRSLAVVSLGLDRFSGIVSSLGHRAGDEVIKLTAAALRARIGEAEVLGHLNGHEFVIGLPGRDAREAVDWIERQAETLRAGVQLANANISLQVTGGVACYPEHSRDAAELCRRASSARSNAIARHETAAVYRLGQDDRSLQQVRIVGDLPQALSNGDLRLWFQPKLDLKTGEIYGAEALVRWQHHELGLLMPDTFIGAIEQAGSIAHLTRWVLREAVARCAAWRKQGVTLGVAVNISVDDLTDEYLPYFLLDLTKKHKIAPHTLTLEVTESAIMHNVQKSLAVVNCIHELGFRLSIDDFGTGHSALGQLKRLPVDELKVDKSFIMGSSDDGKDDAILRSVIGLAHELDLDVVAEGVENDATIARLASLGCEHAQGYGIGKPIPQEQFLAWIAQRRAGGRAAVVPLPVPIVPAASRT